MSITLDGITLPIDLEWVDEFDWLPVRQNAEVAISGALVVEEAAQTKGRRITLSGGPNAGLATRSTVEAVYAMAEVPGQTRTLVYFGRTFEVLFRHGEQPIEAKQFRRQRNPGAGNLYTLTLRLMEVA